MKKGTYNNLVDLSKQNNTYISWSTEVDDGNGRTLEDYLDDYSDRDIVTAFLTDMSNTTTNFKFKVYKIWDDGCIDWRNTKIEIL